MRPAAIIWFERLQLLSIAIGILVAMATWRDSVEEALLQGHGMGFVLSIDVLVTGVFLVLTLFVSRRKSVVAKWILVASFALGFGLLLLGRQYLVQDGPLGLAGFAQAALQIVALALLFTSEAIDWFASGRPTRPAP